ncbi:MAG: acyl-CoA ligase (AMP-forming), exosortase system-associated [Massilia sp.]|nr:acyl-CoA ligase (AMP-forming), exosortase system-associated [Massilia sp.]
MAELLHELILESACRTPAAAALRHGDAELDYAALAQQVQQAADGLLELGLQAQDRVAVWLDKRIETVAALFGAALAGGVLVPVNPLLRAGQAAFILRDSGARMLVTTPERFGALAPLLAGCPDLRVAVLCGAACAGQPGSTVMAWDDCMRGQGGRREPHRRIESDIAALLYTSGSCGQPKGVVLSHRNLVAGAHSVVRYLGNSSADRLLAALPLSFDYGFSQLTTAFSCGASVVLMNHLLLRDIVDTVAQERITGLAATPPWWIQLAGLRWDDAASLRYLTSSGGTMPRATIDALRVALPHARIYLMYGLTEAFRSTWLAPEQLGVRPGSIGKAVPNAQVLVLRPDGSACAAEEPGELVHCGPLVSLGYWNDPAATAERFRPLPAGDGRPVAQTALWSGDTVRMDDEGFLYFIGRSDDMIKTGGYRVSPTEVEEVIGATGLVEEAAAIGVPHPVLGQAIVVLATAVDGAELDAGALFAACRASLPAYMLPAMVDVRARPLPRNANGKVDRRLLAAELAHLFAEMAS